MKLFAPLNVHKLHVYWEISNFDLLSQTQEFNIIFVYKKTKNP